MCGRAEFHPVRDRGGGGQRNRNVEYVIEFIIAFKE
jgi:hypothetical protein